MKFFLHVTPIVIIIRYFFPYIYCVYSTIPLCDLGTYGSNCYCSSLHPFSYKEFVDWRFWISWMDIQLELWDFFPALHCWLHRVFVDSTRSWNFRNIEISTMCIRKIGVVTLCGHSYNSPEIPLLILFKFCIDLHKMQLIIPHC